jgi:hypothetical protein
MDTGGPMDGLTADQCHRNASRSDGSLIGPRRGKWLLPRCWLRATKEIRGIFALGLPARRERQCRRATEQRDELAPPDRSLTRGSHPIVAGILPCASQQNWPLMSEMGQEQTSHGRVVTWECPLRPESGQTADRLGKSALCQLRLNAAQQRSTPIPSPRRRERAASAARLSVND